MASVTGLSVHSINAPHWIRGPGPVLGRRVIA
jgi:hypothetical protein